MHNKQLVCAQEANYFRQSFYKYNIYFACSGCLNKYSKQRVTELNITNITERAQQHKVRGCIAHKQLKNINYIT